MDTFEPKAGFWRGECMLHSQSIGRPKVAAGHTSLEVSEGDWRNRQLVSSAIAEMLAIYIRAEIVVMRSRDQAGEFDPAVVAQIAKDSEVGHRCHCVKACGIFAFWSADRRIPQQGLS